MTRTEAEQRVLEAAWELARHPLRAGALMALNDAALALSDATEDAAPASPWRPIETAPRDGTRILISCGASGYVTLAIAADEARFENALGHLLVEPRAWQPLPEGLPFTPNGQPFLPVPPTTSDGSK